MNKRITFIRVTPVIRGLFVPLLFGFTLLSFGLASVSFAQSDSSATQANSASNQKCNTEEHQQFDFWLGEWSVVANEKPAGHNSIERVQGGCVIRESWVSENQGYTGTSYNFYNARSEKWQQLWLDNQGGFLELSGSLQDGSMVLSSKPTPNKDGKTLVNQITWTPNADGTVRQLWEVLVEGEKPQIAFDGLYSPAE